MITLSFHSRHNSHDCIEEKSFDIIFETMEFTPFFLFFTCILPSKIICTLDVENRLGKLEKEVQDVKELLMKVLDAVEEHAVQIERKNEKDQWFEQELISLKNAELPTSTKLIVLVRKF